MPSFPHRYIDACLLPVNRLPIFRCGLTKSKYIDNQNVQVQMHLRDRQVSNN